MTLDIVSRSVRYGLYRPLCFGYPAEMTENRDQGDLELYIVYVFRGVANRLPCVCKRCL